MLEKMRNLVELVQSEAVKIEPKCKELTEIRVIPFESREDDREVWETHDHVILTWEGDYFFYIERQNGMFLISERLISIPNIYVLSDFKTFEELEQFIIKNMKVFVDDIVTSVEDYYGL